MNELRDGKANLNALPTTIRAGTSAMGRDTVTKRRSGKEDLAKIGAHGEICPAGIEAVERRRVRQTRAMWTGKAATVTTYAS